MTHAATSRSGMWNVPSRQRHGSPPRFLELARAALGGALHAGGAAVFLRPCGSAPASAQGRTGHGTGHGERPPPPAPRTLRPASVHGRSEAGRVFMRRSVLACDVLLFLPAAWACAAAGAPRGGARLGFFALVCVRARARARARARGRGRATAKSKAQPHPGQVRAAGARPRRPRPLPVQLRLLGAGAVGDVRGHDG